MWVLSSSVRDPVSQTINSNLFISLPWLDGIPSIVMHFVHNAMAYTLVFSRSSVRI